jgi:hypothetical protein
MDRKKIDDLVGQGHYDAWLKLEKDIAYHTSEFVNYRGIFSRFRNMPSTLFMSVTLYRNQYLGQIVDEVSIEIQRFDFLTSEYRRLLNAISVGKPREKKYALKDFQKINIMHSCVKIITFILKDTCQFLEKHKKIFNTIAELERYSPPRLERFIRLFNEFLVKHEEMNTAFVYAALDVAWAFLTKGYGFPLKAGLEGVKTTIEIIGKPPKNEAGEYVKYTNKAAGVLVEGFDYTAGKKLKKYLLGKTDYLPKVYNLQFNRFFRAAGPASTVIDLYFSFAEAGDKLVDTGIVVKQFQDAAKELSMISREAESIRIYLDREKCNFVQFRQKFRMDMYHYETYKAEFTKLDALGQG